MLTQCSLLLGSFNSGRLKTAEFTAPTSNSLQYLPLHLVSSGLSSLKQILPGADHSQYLWIYSYMQESWF